MCRIRYIYVCQWYGDVVPTFLHLKGLQWTVCLLSMDDSCIPKKVLGGCFGRRPVREPRSTREGAGRRDAVGLLEI